MYWHQTYLVLLLLRHYLYMQLTSVRRGYLAPVLGIRNSIQHMRLMTEARYHLATWGSWEPTPVMLQAVQAVNVSGSVEAHPTLMRKNNTVRWL